MSFLYEYYYIILIIQGLCVFHSFRKGTQGKWLWVIVILPLVGSLIYFYSEILGSRELDSVKSSVGSLFNPGGGVRRLESNLNLSDTFENKVALADAYLLNNRISEAQHLYESSLTGIFKDNEFVINKLIQIYYSQKEHNKIVQYAPKISNSFDFSRSPAHLYYAIALEEVKRDDEAELEYKKLDTRFSNFEARYRYALLLKRKNKTIEAKEVLRHLLDEAGKMDRKEIGHARIWVDKAKMEV